MIKKYLPHILRFLLLTFVQVVFLNKMYLFDYAHPYIYILFIFLLPIHINKSALIFLGFISGAVIDIFSGSMGIHAGATAFIAFLRPFIITGISTNLDLESKKIPSINEMKISWFIIYCVILVFLHHAFLYLVESLRIDEVLYLLYKIIVNSILTLLIIFIVVLLFKKEK